ncbi:LytTR family DNA-binding domain-containing protein [Lachnospiraceae bacterium ZAX-1]
MNGEKMLSIFICDDEQKQLEKIYEVVQKSILMQDFNFKIALATTRPQQLIEYLEHNNVNGLYFLDIDFKQDINGFTLANTIRTYDPRGFIVFITAHSEMSYMAFEYGVEALGYILKDFPNQIEPKIQQYMNQAYERCSNQGHNGEELIQISYEGKAIYLNLNDVIYVDSSVALHKLELLTQTGRISFYGSLKNFETKLNENFMRCHKSFIVNVNYINAIDRKNKQIILKNNSSIPISIKFIKPLLDRLAK